MYPGSPFLRQSSSKLWASGLPATSGPPSRLCFHRFLSGGSIRSSVLNGHRAEGPGGLPRFLRRKSVAYTCGLLAINYGLLCIILCYLAFQEATRPQSSFKPPEISLKLWAIVYTVGHIPHIPDSPTARFLIKSHPTVIYFLTMLVTLALLSIIAPCLGDFCEIHKPPWRTI